MNKFLIVVPLFLFTLLFLSPAKVFAGASIDQEYYKDGDVSHKIKADVIAVQSFRPALSNLDKVEVNLRNATGTVSCELDRYNGTDWDPVRYINNQPVVNGWNTFDFENVDVTVDGRYRILLQASADATAWYYGTLEPYGPYSRGIAQWGQYYDDHANTDFQFRTWGTNPVEIVAEQDISVQQNSSPETVAIPVGQTTGTGGVPAATTSDAIKPASGLKAVYQNSSVNLTWSASTTTSIDGYKVFRSTVATTGFVEIGKTVKATLEFIDTKNLAVDQTYYYIVRAYKANEESVSTSTVTITIPQANATTSAESTKKVVPYSALSVDDTNYSEIQLYWILGGIIGVLLVLLVAHERERSKTTKVISGKSFRLEK